MKKKTIVIGDQSFIIAELNTAQVDELTSFQAPEGEDPGSAWRRRLWRTLLLGLNNAVQPPTKDNPLGSDHAPHSEGDLQPALGFASVTELHNEVLALSGLRSAAAGESKATADKA